MFVTAYSDISINHVFLLFNKLYERFGTPLKNWDIKINYGIKTGCNEAFIIDETKRKEILDNCKSADERERTDKIIRPILRGRDIRRNGYEWPNLYIITTHNGYKDNYGHVVPRIDVNHFPALKEWFDNGDWNDKLEKGTNYSRLSNRTDKGDTPYNLRDCAYMDDFSRQRFIWTAVNSEYRFLAIEEEIYYNNSIFHGVSDKAKGIASIMNSLIMKYYLRLLSTEGYQYGGKEMMGQMPIISDIENVEYSKEKLKSLYHLTDEEMNLISSSVK